MNHTLRPAPGLPVTHPGFDQQPEGLSLTVTIDRFRDDNHADRHAAVLAAIWLCGTTYPEVLIDPLASPLHVEMLSETRVARTWEVVFRVFES